MHKTFKKKKRIYLKPGSKSLIQFNLDFYPVKDEIELNLVLNCHIIKVKGNFYRAFRKTFRKNEFS